MSENMYIDKLDDMIKKYNNTYQRTSKMKPVDVKPSTYIEFDKENNKEGPKFKVGDNVRMSKINIFLQKAMFQIGLKKFLRLKNLKILFRGHMLLVILKAEKLLKPFTKKNYKKQNKNNLGQK